MSTLSPTQQAEVAIRHMLTQIRDYPEVGWYLGQCTQTFELLTEAYAALVGRPVEEVKDAFEPLHPIDPRAESRTSDPSGLTEEGAEALAEQIVEDLMVNSERQRGTRLVLMDRDDHDLGAWQPVELRDRLAGHLLGKEVMA